jgi:hypothetical protein
MTDASDELRDHIAGPGGVISAIDKEMAAVSKVTSAWANYRSTL